MSYDPTERAPQPPDQQPQYGQAPQPPAQQPPATPPVYNQSNPALPTYEQPTQAAPQPAYGQSNPGLPPYGQPTQAATPPAYGQSNPSLPPYGQMPQTPATPPAYGQSNPSLPPYGQAPTEQAQVAPTYGQSNPSLPPYGQAPQAPTEQAAYGQYEQPTVESAYPPQQPGTPYAPVPGQPYQPGQPWAPGMPPAFPPSAAPKKKRGLLIAIISVIVVILVVAGGVIGYVVTRPKPILSLSSTYNDGSTPIGASGTTFSVTGTDFTGNSAVTFLLDGNPAPGVPPAQSDSNGKVSATLTVTDAWGTGNHHLTAKDAAGYLTQLGKALTIVVAGQDKTPGPNGAPTDSASGTINTNVTAGTSSGSITLNVTGSSNGGTVCAARDDGQPHTHNGTTADGSFTETITQTCSGTYKGGKLSYTETVTSDKITFTSGAINGVSCTAQTPYTSAHMEGTFTSSTSINGTYSDDTVTITCSLGGVTRTDNSPGQSGTWTGNASMQ